MPRNNRPANNGRFPGRSSGRGPHRGVRVPDGHDEDGAGFDITRVLDGVQRRQSIAGEIWMVRTISAGRSEKSYTCPGCNQPIPATVAHTVAWLEEGAWGRAQGLDARRHWHNSCWRSRS